MGVARDLRWLLSHRRRKLSPYVTLNGHCAHDGDMFKHGVVVLYCTLIYQLMDQSRAVRTGFRYSSANSLETSAALARSARGFYLCKLKQATTGTPKCCR